MHLGNGKISSPEFRAFFADSETESEKQSPNKMFTCYMEIL